MKRHEVIAPIVILLAAAAAAAWMVHARKPVATAPAPPNVPLVRVLKAQPEDRTLIVHAQGTVLPHSETTLVAQVAGEIIHTAEDFVAGGFFERDQELVRIDDRDYRLALERARAEVAQAKLRLEQERAEARLAAEQWQALGEGDEPDPLVLRKPQLAQLEAASAAAEASVGQAELALERTEVLARFAGRIRSVGAGRGQYVTPGTPLATVHPIDYAEVRLPIEDRELAFLDLGLSDRGHTTNTRHGPRVALIAAFGGHNHVWQGRIVRTEGELDPRTRMLALVARVDDPYRRSAGTRSRSGNDDPSPLPVGLFVRAEISGRRVNGVIALPRTAVRRLPRALEDQVLVVDEQDRLRLRSVTVLRMEGDQALIIGGLTAGERIVVSSLDVVVDGMAVRTVLDRQATPREPRG